jgi:nucleotide sugar dehydrogenase
VKIAVVGLGKIGLPLAAQYSSLGHEVIGCDVNSEIVRKINRGESTIEGEPGLDEMIASAVAHGLLVATTKTSEAVTSSEAVVVVVPLVVDGEGNPIFGIMDSATKDVGRGLSKGTVVCFETTLPVGTTRNRLTPILESESGLRAGTDFFVVFSPERVFTGRIFDNLKKYPKLIGGIDPASAEAGINFYSKVLTFSERTDLARPNGVWDLGSAEAAEFAKLAETTYRDVNIGLANQFALFAQKAAINFYEVIEACNSQPFSHIHEPGIAVGGHCIPVYPHLYLQGHPEASIVSTARQANSDMPLKMIELIERELGNLRGLRFAILGLSYRGGVKEHAFSGAWPLVEILESRGAIAEILDPLYSKSEIDELSLNYLGNPKEVDAIILQAPHKEFLNLKPIDFPKARLILDGRNFVEKSFKGGHIKYISVGNGVN